MNLTAIEMSPKEGEKCCQNCRYFYKWGVHLGFCSQTSTDKLDHQECEKFELETEMKENL